VRKNQEGRQGLGLRLPRPCRLCAFAAFFRGRATDVEGLFTCHRATAVGSEEARLRAGLRPQAVAVGRTERNLGECAKWLGYRLCHK